MAELACFSVFLGNFSEIECCYSFQLRSHPGVEAFGEYFASCLSTLATKFGAEKPSFIAIGLGLILAYFTLAVVGLDYFSLY